MLFPPQTWPRCSVCCLGEWPCFQEVPWEVTLIPPSGSPPPIQPVLNPATASHHKATVLPLRATARLSSPLGPPAHPPHSGWKALTFPLLHQRIFLQHRLPAQNVVKASRCSQDAQMVKDPPAHAGDAGSIPGSGSSLGEGNGYPLQCSSLENPMDRGVRWAIVPGVTKGRTRLSD